MKAQLKQLMAWVELQQPGTAGETLCRLAPLFAPAWQQPFGVPFDLDVKTMWKSGPAFPRRDDKPIACPAIQYA